MTKAEEVLQEIKQAYPNMPYYDDNKLSNVLWGKWSHDPVEERGETGDQRRWITYETTYWRFDDNSWLAIEWASGNTEMQESEGPYDMYLVEQYEETITVKKYRKLK
jgi:hypothetical protein